ncbi:MAG: NUDIX hydrolase [Rubrivivax sp.]
MAADEHLIEQRLSGRTLWGDGWLKLDCDEVRLPDGSHATREFIRHGGALAVVPLLNDGRMVLVRQYRYPLSRVMLELPAGKRDPGESTVGCGQRELLEETGYSAAEWAYGGAIHNAAAYSTETIWIWFARGLQAGPQRLDPGEFVEPVLLDDLQLLQMELAGQLTDVKTLLGLHWLRQWRAGTRRLAWQAADAAKDVAADPVALAPGGSATDRNGTPR